MTTPLHAVNSFNVKMLHQLVDDWPEDQLDWQPHPGLHSARWLLVHLAIAVDYGLMQLELPGCCAASWHQHYGPGSQPGSVALRPSKSEVLKVIDDGYARLRDNLGKVSVPPLTDIHQVQLLANTPLQTKGEIVGHIVSSHFSFHLGQLSTLRRMLGRPPLF